VIEKDNDFTMIYKMARRLSDEKLYYIFLLRKSDQSVIDINEPFYLITLRDVKDINELYDLDISLDMARKIFSKKDSSPAEVQRLITFDTNRNEFILMLSCLDIINGEFTVDFKKFRTL
jgi:hypothetical protein